MTPAKCDHCGYDLTGTSTDAAGTRCPKCGKLALLPNAPTTVTSKRVSKRITLLVGVCPYVVGSMLVLHNGMLPYFGLSENILIPSVMLAMLLLFSTSASFLRAWMEPDRTMRFKRGLRVLIWCLTLNFGITLLCVVALVSLSFWAFSSFFNHMGVVSSL